MFRNVICIVGLLLVAAGSVRGQPYTSRTQMTNIVYGAATALKNGDVGLDGCWRFKSTFYYTNNRPVFVWAIGDQSTFPSGGTWLTEAIRQGRPHEGGLGSGFSDVGTLRINTNGLVYQNNQNSGNPDPANISFTGSGWWEVPLNATITWDRIGAGTGITDTNHFCDTFKLFYLKEPNAGTFKVQTNISGGGWGDMITITANNGTTNGAVLSSNVVAGYYAFRVLGLTGTNRIFDAAVYNSTARNYVPILLNDAGGASFVTLTNCQTNIFLTFLQAWNPDLMLFQDTGGTANLPAIQYLDPLIPGVVTNADRIYMGWANITAGVADGNAAMQQFAVTNVFSVGYFDIANIWLTNDINDLISKGLMDPDRVHATSFGADALNSMLWDRVMNTHYTTNGGSLINIPMTGIVQPGTIVTNGMSPAITLSNNVTVRGTINSYGPASSLILQERGGSGVFFNFYPPNGNQMAMDYNGLGIYLNILTNGSTIAFSPADSFSKPMTLGDNAQGWKAIWMATPTGRAYWQHDSIEELLTLSTGAATTDTAGNLLPANSVIEAVCTRVTTTITTAATFSVGDGTTAARFSASAAGITAGSTRVGLDHMSGAVTTLAAGPTQAAAAKVRITCNANPGAGIVRITVFYKTFIAPGQ